MNKPELISPAGTLEKLKIAFEFGADAVYAGVPEFSLRARINDFTYVKIKKGAEYAHARGKKLYATLNIYARNSHLKKIEESAKKYYAAGVDGVIVSDPGVLAMVKKVTPKMEIHLSTQANCTNWAAAKFWFEAGVRRIVLAREITLPEISEIHEKLPELELEYFVHGAMCMSYSGRCILSKWLSNRSANQGECSQPCRWEYTVEDEGQQGVTLRERETADKEKKLIADEDQHGTYIFNSKDLCLIEHLEKLYKAGVTSFKIEGRTKSAYYVGAITKLYREGIDRIGKRERGVQEVKYEPPKGWKEELDKIQNRGYTTGFLFGESHCEHNFLKSHQDCAWQFVGEVIKSHKGKVFIKIHNQLNVGDEIEFILPRGRNLKIRVKKLYDGKSGKEIEEVHGGQEQIAIIDGNIPCMSLVRRKLS